ncbi:MAG: hypothetical protein H7Y38_12575 [Armatimonadetes bacterium]|nr:hypothetical protein [Armatimonadota bacterium]
MQGFIDVNKWSRDSIVGEILRRHDTDQPLSYSGMTRDNLPLLRAATRYFGSWQNAIEYAGLDYNDFRKYRTWTNETIVERIQELYAQNADLSWRHISLTLDPSVAAAATKKAHFGSWRAALEAAGIDYDVIRRYHDWSDDEVIRKVRDLYAQGEPLNAKSMEQSDITLITAARRRFPSWDKTLSAAGLDYKNIVVRAPFRRKRKTESVRPTSPSAATR